MSISGLPFVKVEGSLALSIVFTMNEEETQGSLRMADKDRQFEWRICDERLRDVALEIHRIATNSEHIDFFEVHLLPSSAARLVFLVASERQDAT